MVNWEDPQIRLAIYLIYGTSFIAMFLAMTIWRNRTTHIEVLNDFKYLAFFGLLHGLTEYSDIPRFLAWQPAWAYDLIKLFLVSSSFASLLAFGLNVISAGIEDRRWLRGIPYGALLIYFWLLIFMGIESIFTGIGQMIDPAIGNIGMNYNAADLAQRYSLGFLGAIISSYAFLELAEKMNTIIGEKAERKFIYAGAGFGLYAIFGGLLVNPLFGVPIIVYRSIVAIFMTVAVIGLFELFREKKEEKTA